MSRTGHDSETCLRWVERHQQVRAFDASDRAITYSTGTVIGYYSQPTLVIETASGERLVWAAGLCEEGPIQVTGRPSLGSADVATAWRDEPEHEGRVYVRNGWPALAAALDALVDASNPQVE